MVRESLQPGAVVQAVADRNGVSTAQLYTWRKEMLAAAVFLVALALFHRRHAALHVGDAGRGRGPRRLRSAEDLSAGPLAPLLIAERQGHSESLARRCSGGRHTRALAPHA